MLKLKLQYFGHLMQRANSLEKTLILGRIEGRRRRGQQRMRWLDGIIDSMDGPQVAMTGEARGCSRAAAPVCGFSRGTTARSVGPEHVEGPLVTTQPVQI